MMTFTKKPKTAMTSEEKKPTIQGAVAVTEVLEAFALIPVHMLAENRNQSMPSWLHHQSGLSKARISQGNIDRVRPSTLKKIEVHQQRLLEEQHTDPEMLSYARKQIATAPQTRAGMHGIWSGWIHMVEVLPQIPLPISKEVGLVIDELIEALLAACRDEDLAKFKQILLRHIEHHGVAVRVGEEPGAEFATESVLVKLLALEDWAQTASFTKRFSDNLYLDMISALDAEWSSHYFSGRQNSPLFPLVMVRPQNGLLKGHMSGSRKNLFFRPSRRLLESLYALVFYIRHKKWPTKPPSPQTLANILYRPGEQEVLDNTVVSSYFDGSTQLTFDLVCDYWEQMFHYFMPERNEGEKIDPPLPMIMLALQWQTLFVEDRGKSFLLLDLERYNLLWLHRRQQWEVHQVKQNKLSPQSSHKNEDPIEWPVWMLSQSSSSF